MSKIPGHARVVIVGGGAVGPRSRELLQPLVDADLSTEAFAFSTARQFEIGMGIARAHRISYVGELGWEIYVSADMARHVFDAIAERGDGMGLKLCGIHAFDSCRIEKAYRHCGHDISSEDNVLEAGLGFAVRPDKAAGCFGPFIGRDAVLRTRETGVPRRLVQFRLEAQEPLLYHNEPILRDGRIVGRVTSGAYGHHLGSAIGLGYVPVDSGESEDTLLSSRYSIEVAGERYPAVASLRGFYDPTSARVRA